MFINRDRELKTLEDEYQKPTAWLLMSIKTFVN